MADRAVRFCIDTKAVVITTDTTANAARFDQAVKLFITHQNKRKNRLALVRKVIQIPESGNFRLVESRIREIFSCGIRNARLGNPVFR